MMETMTKNSWTAERLDDLNLRVEDGFRRVDADLREVRGEIALLRSETKTEIASLRGEMNARFERVDARFDALQRTLLQFGGVLVAALIGVIATLIATQV